MLTFSPRTKNEVEKYRCRFTIKPIERQAGEKSGTGRPIILSYTGNINTRLKMQIFVKDTILKVLGYFLLVFGIFMFFVGVGMLVDKDQSDVENAPSIIVFSGAFIIPAALLIYLGRKASKEEEELKSLASIVKSYRRIALVNLAEKLHMTIPAAENLLSKALSRGLISGNFDRTTDEFYTDEARPQNLKFKYCPNCGAPLDRIYLEGETVRCQNCGFLMN